MTEQDRISGRPGVAVDANGNPVIDPTKNVLDLVHSAIRRVDDMIVLNNKRIDDIAAERVKRLEGEQKLRAEYHDKLMIAESKRIDAIRNTDMTAATLANERATQQADILARQVAQTADVLRALVDSTAKQMATQHEQTTRLISERVTLLEKNQYEAQGKSGVVDPQQSEYVAELKRLRETSTLRTGASEGMSAMWGYIIAAIATISAIVTMAHILLSRVG